MWNAIKLYIPFVLLELFLALGIVLCSVNYSKTEYFQQMYRDGVTAEATIVTVKMHSDSSDGSFHGGTSYYTYYRYVDEIGTEYTGLAYITPDLDKAKSYLKSKVTIYIDGKGESFWEGRIPTRPWEAIIMIIVFSVMFLGVIVFFIVLHWWINKKYGKKAEKDSVEQSDEIVIYKGKKAVVKTKPKK